VRKQASARPHIFSKEMTTSQQRRKASQADSKRETFALVMQWRGWIVPRLGHALLKMWGARGLFPHRGPAGVFWRRDARKRFHFECK